MIIIERSQSTRSFMYTVIRVIIIIVIVSRYCTAADLFQLSTVRMFLLYRMDVSDPLVAREGTKHTHSSWDDCVHAQWPTRCNHWQVWVQGIHPPALSCSVSNYFFCNFPPEGCPRVPFWRSRLWRPRVYNHRTRMRIFAPFRIFQKITHFINANEFSK